MRDPKKKKKRSSAGFLGTVIDPKRFSRTQLKFYFILVPLALFMVLPVYLTIAVLRHLRFPYQSYHLYSPTGMRIHCHRIWQ